MKTQTKEKRIVMNEKGFPTRGSYRMTWEQAHDENILRKNYGIKPGMTIYTSVKKVARSGMSRRIECFMVEGSEIHNITGFVASILGYGRNDDGMAVGGCGMDMGFHVVYNLSRTLFADSHICTGQGCRSNDHSNGDRDYTPHKHSDGGYALSQRWL